MRSSAISQKGVSSALHKRRGTTVSQNTGTNTTVSYYSCWQRHPWKTVSILTAESELAN
ncbi:hypothetical protein COCC4DRAFT_32432 [Bipolaris maydis ATCC 48331]|uniref:Uncharacterized protein n=1 Tax=Cochliobolus heterostrophus (strain C4 / ATCC 48331 / race T) TaxID=665024 RepID=N4XI53_COCH4|nr:uncharacterized protein COCC4DRAFT_32432 [Bipolaris maydis ATCC 48331]ENI04817.1 hypothetical protein COCC4DRAFT_32432 [Bipolaris maydis ATCC 48331]